MERVIGGGHVDYDRFFTMCPGTAIISIDTYGTNPTVGLFIQAGSSGPIVCDRRFASDSHTCTFTVHQRQRFYVRVINYAHHGVPYRFISN
ncbi:hypothetical protein [Acuticoccus mangrovi]|uniref:Peptidase C-terminal archaeal/bacterial domain-containing protein n=1 Tax=Acuticoccus mangrovi TaxID=2796142 RepID=A0A934IT46_9HYPH|nr:hypothetical protein [Acuticoccus mangrovi]MBJ3777712.1 hypothetical protein [Acuticoccus mangrovi]